MGISAQLHDGTRLEFPDGTDPAVIQRTVKSLLAGKQTPARSPDPTSDSDFENMAAGVGQGAVSLARGVGQLARKIPGVEGIADRMGLPGDQATIDEAKRLDAPLLDTKAGLAGSVMGQMIPAVVAAPLGGAGLVGGAGVGAAMGAVQPVASDDSRLMNMAVGGVAGAAGPLVARGVSAGVGAARGLVEPFTEGGRTAIAGRTLRRFGVGDADVQGLSGAPTVTGARTTLAEQITRPEGAAGAARLQDAVRQLDPEIAARMEAREVANNGARVGTLERLAGQDGGRDFAVAERAGTAAPMYDDAFRVAADGRPLNAEQSRAMQQLMRAPDIQSAMKQAQRNAANSGANVGASNASGSVEGLHQVKLALDDAIGKAQSGSSAAEVNRLAGLQDAQKRLVGFIESISPEYANARGVYAQMSRPVNQMDVAQRVLDKGTNGSRDLAGTLRLMPGSVAGVMRDEPALIRQATGRSGLASSLQDLLEPEQLSALGGVTNELSRYAAVSRAANGPGSGTAQRLASTNLLHQIGIPESMADNALVQTLMRPVQFGAKVAEPRIQQNLLELILDPSKAQAAMRAASPSQRIELQRLIGNPELAQAVRSSAPAAVLGARQRSE